MILIMLLGLGLILGSFVNAFVWRIHSKKNWVSERSECPHCHHVLAPVDLIPVVSWLLLKGKCRYCAQPIEDSPFVELGLSLAFGASYLLWPVELTGAGIYQFIFWLILLVGFMALTVYDLRWFLLPNKIVFPLIAVGFLQIIGLPLFYHYGWNVVVGALLGALIMSGIFYVLFQISKGEWIGGGDVKLAIVLGLLAGDPMRATLVLFFASFLGILAATPQLISGGYQRMKLKIPFGPFLIAGLVIVQFFGTPIINWYVHLFAV